MRLLLVFRLAVIACIAAAAIGQASACKCASSYHGRNDWEVAKLESDGSTAIFEGTPESFELKWGVLSVQEGAWIPASDSGGSAHNDWPQMIVTFRVQRAYKGDLGQQVKVSTGLGGGDCGAVFNPGLVYLVFLSKGNLPGFSVNMCSPGGWIGASSVAVELRYLRKEPPIARDLAAYKPWSANEYAAQEELRRREGEQYQKRYAAVTGKICGVVSAEKKTGENAGTISFLSTAGYSPVAHPTMGVGADGSFCSPPLGPGKYYLFYSKGSQAGLTSTVYYPGVNERVRTMPIEVGAGQTRSGLAFKIPVQKTYAVRGFISTNDKSGLRAGDVYIALVNTDGAPSAEYGQQIDFQSSFPLPKVKYFNFENVLPGRYIAYVSVFGRGWYTKKEELNVTTHMKFISLELMHKK
jgi:hypothetical protein